MIEEAASSLLNIQQRIASHEQTYHRAKNAVMLLAVSKGQAVEKILSLFAAGQRLFGENYLQEALLKINACAPRPIEWHFIGPVQSNKTKKIAEHFAWVQSVASQKIAKRLNDQRPPSMPLLNICIEVNISGEPAKSGVAPEEAHGLVDYCLALPRLQLRGLMTIPARQDLLAAQRLVYRKLYVLWKNLAPHGGQHWDTLSMGMSQDMEAAIAEGATMVRIGRALFDKY